MNKTIRTYSLKVFTMVLQGLMYMSTFYTNYMHKPVVQKYNNLVGDSIEEVILYDTDTMTKTTLFQMTWFMVCIHYITRKLMPHDDTMSFVSDSYPLGNDQRHIFQITYRKGGVVKKALVKNKLRFNIEEDDKSVSKSLRKKFLYCSIGDMDFTDYINKTALLGSINVLDLFAVTFMQNKANAHKYMQQIMLSGFTINTIDNDTLEEQVFKDTCILKE
jgi:hypothetical protein